MIRNPIFIIGTERSGSNLLRLILNTHSHIVIPHPPHIVRYFHPRQAGYGDLSRDKNFRRLVDDVLGLLDVHIYPWEITIDPSEVVRAAPPRDIFGIFAALYEAARAAANKPRWGCKSTFMIAHVSEILTLFPDTRLLLLVRDPRDVAASSRESVFSPFHPYFSARLWLEQQETGLRLLDTLPEHTIQLVRYEDLVRDAPGTIEQICTYLKEPFEPSMLRHFETNEAKRSGALSDSWRKTARPVDSGSVGRFRRDLTEEEIGIVEAVALEPMRRLGYAPVNSEPALRAARFSIARRTQFWLSDLAWHMRIEARSFRNDRNFGRRWARGFYVRTLDIRRGKALLRVQRLLNQRRGRA